MSPPSSSAPRRRWFPFLLFIASCCGGDGCGSRGCSPDLSTSCDESKCAQGSHCDGIVFATCTVGCRDDSECSQGLRCSRNFLSAVGTCIKGCTSDSDCTGGQICNVAIFGPSVASCADPPAGSSGSSGQGGAGHSGAGSGGSGQSGGAGKGGAASAGSGGTSTTEICSLQKDGSCKPATPEVICCRLVGHVYDEKQGCLVAGDMPPTTVWCLPEQENDAGTCVYTASPACYERSLPDGTDEIALVTLGVPAEMLPAEITTCAQPPATTPPTCPSP